MRTTKNISKLDDFFTSHLACKRKLVEESGFSRRHVDYVLKRKRKNDQIISCAINIYKEYKSKEIKL